MATSASPFETRFPLLRVRRWLSAPDRRSELLEELVRHLLGGTIDQPLPELGELAADLGFHVVGEQRAAILVGELDDRAALGEARDPALALPDDLVAVRRIEIGERHFA